MSFKSILEATVLGILISSVSFLMFILMDGAVLITSSEIISVWIMGAIIGCTIELLLDSPLPFLWVIISHFVITLLTSIISSLLNHWIVNNVTSIMMITIYVIILYIIIWLTIGFFQNKEAHQINSLIHQRKNKK